MSLTLRRIAILIFVAYLVLTCYTAYILLSKSSGSSRKEVQRTWSISGEDEWNPWGEELEQESKRVPVSQVEKFKVKWWSNKTLDFGKNFQKPSAGTGTEYSIEIWGKAAIGLFLWEHILEGKLERKMNGIWSYGFKKIDNLKFKFRTGPGVIPSKVPTTVQNLVLVLNGHNDDKINAAKMWLDFLPQLPFLRNVAIIMHGNEQCNNEWLLPYMSTNYGIVKVMFIVYDSPLVDNENFFQWPLGVAMYRSFPKIDSHRLEIEKPRPYICNFVGTIYPNSSREKMMEVIRKKGLEKDCFIKTRPEWVAVETKQSMEAYVLALQLSDLTLNPVGQNTECYRIYEALSLGSIPIIEDVMTSGQCSDNSGYRGHATMPNSPLRILKEYDAPVIFVSDWDELPSVIEKEALISPAEKIRRRRSAILWYEEFKTKLKDKFVSILKQKFLANTIR